jgi:hypothetical protein
MDLVWSLYSRLQRPGLSLVPGGDAANAGRITAAGLTKEFNFEPVDGSINDHIDEAYQRNTETARTSAR